MKQVLQRIYTDPFAARLYQWAKVVTFTGVGQAIVQGVTFVCGILVIRLLPTNEYAFYVLANTMAATMGVLADGGVSTGVASQGGLVWKDRERLGAVLTTGFSLKRRFATGSLVVATPVLVFMLFNHGAGVLSTILIALSVIFVFVNTLSGSLFQVAPKLHQDILPLQKNQVTLNLIRLVISAIALVFFPFAFLAVIAAGIAQMWSNKNLKKISTRYADWSQAPDSNVRVGILRFVKRLLPGSIYFCISGQISIWLISVFGSTTSVAQIGALTRLTLILNFFSVLINVLIVPRFVRLAEDKVIILKYYLRIQLLLLAIGAGCVLMSWIFSGQILWIIGRNYMHLESELVLCVIGGFLNLAVGINYILNSGRGWLLHPLMGISIGMAGIIVGVTLIDVSTLRGVLLFNIFTGVVGLFVHPLYGFLKIASLNSKKLK